MPVTRSLSTRLAGRVGMVRRRAQGRWATPLLLRKRYRAAFGRELNPMQPATMSEKVFARMYLMDRHDDTSVHPLVDKLVVREVIESVVGREHVIPLLWSGDDPRQIPLDRVARPSMLKPTHLTGGVIRIDDALDDAWARRHAAGWLREDLYWAGREFQYYRLPRRLMIESFLSDDIPDGPLDYSVWCFHGQPRMVQLRNHTRDINYFVDLDFTTITVYSAGARDLQVPRPPQWERLLQVAQALSEPFEFVRVDCYAIDDRVYVGELTFTPASGKLRFADPGIDARIGGLWHFDPQAPVLDVVAHPTFRTSAHT